MGGTEQREGIADFFPIDASLANRHDDDTYPINLGDVDENLRY